MFAVSLHTRQWKNEKRYGPMGELWVDQSSLRIESWLSTMGIELTLHDGEPSSVSPALNMGIDIWTLIEDAFSSFTLYVADLDVEWTWLDALHVTTLQLKDTQWFTLQLDTQWFNVEPFLIKFVLASVCIPTKKLTLVIKQKRTRSCVSCQYDTSCLKIRFP